MIYPSSRFTTTTYHSSTSTITTTCPVLTHLPCN